MIIVFGGSPRAHQPLRSSALLPSLLGGAVLLLSLSVSFSVGCRGCRLKLCSIGTAACLQRARAFSGAGLSKSGSAKAKRINLGLIVRLSRCQASLRQLLDFDFGVAARNHSNSGRRA